MKKITINGTAAAELGVTGLVIALVNQGASTATITCEGVASTFAGFATGSEIVIQADNLTFRGKVRRRPFHGSGESGTGYQAIVTDAWQDMEDETILTSTTLAANSIGRDTRIAIGGIWVEWTTGSGDDAVATWRLVPMPLADWITRVFHDDHSCSLDSTLAGTWPPAQGDCIKYAEALRMMLRWFPGSVATVAGQQGADGPLITIRTVSTMATFDAPYHADKTRIDPRTDLQIGGVGLMLRKVTTGLGNKEDKVFYTAGTATGPKAFIAAFDLLPEEHQLTSADFQLLKIEPANIDFWRALFPKTFSKPGWDGATLLGGTLSRELVGLTSVVLAGSIPNEFTEKGADGPFGKRAKIFGSANSTTVKIGKVWGVATFSLGDGSTSTLTLTEAQATNLEPINDDDPSIPTRYVYEDHDAQNPGESFADFAGIPAQVFGDGALLTHEGDTEWPVDEIPAFFDLPMGRRIRFPDAPVAAWRTLDAPVYAVQIDCLNRTIRAQYGHDGYLSADDRVSLERAKHAWPRPSQERVHRDDAGNPPETQPPIAPAAPPTIAGSDATLPDLGPFEIVDGGDGTHVRFGRSLLNGSEPTGFDENGIMLIASTGDGVQWVKAEVGAGGSLTTTLGHGTTLPTSTGDNTDGFGIGDILYFQIGTWTRTFDVASGRYKFTGHNDVFGPITIAACRRYYDADELYNLYPTGGSAA